MGVIVDPENAVRGAISVSEARKMCEPQLWRPGLDTAVWVCHNWGDKEAAPRSSGKKRAGRYDYLQVVENHRGSHTRQRVVATLGFGLTSRLMGT